MIIHNITTIIDSAIRTDNANKIIFFIENLSHFRFVEKIFDYYLTNDFEITLLCLENFFESDITISTKIDIVVLKNDIEKIKILNPSKTEKRTSEVNPNHVGMNEVNATHSVELC